MQSLLHDPYAHLTKTERELADARRARLERFKPPAVIAKIDPPALIPAPERPQFWFQILPGYAPTVDMIVRATCRYYGIAKVDFLSERRTRSLARPRQIAMYLAKNLTGLSYPKIGRFMGGFDHSTILHGVKMIGRLMQSDIAIAFDVAELFRAITGDPTGETSEANPHL